jgi:hypothetical protein
MSGPTKISDSLYPVMKDIFVRYLVNKHKKPYRDIKIADMSDEDLKLLTTSRLALVLRAMLKET